MEQGADMAVLQTNLQLLKDQIVDRTSRFVKDATEPVEGGMVRVAFWRLNELDALMVDLDKLERDIAQARIDKM